MKFVLIVLLSFFVLSAGAQVQPNSVQADSVKQAPAPRVKKDNRPWASRFALGGSTGFWITPAQFYLEVSPMLAYRFQKIWTVGSGYRYIYRRDHLYGRNLNSYGPVVFARAQLTKRIYLWSEWEHLTSDYTYQIVGQEVATSKDQVDSFFAGAGYIRQFGRKGRGGISFQLLYNFLYNQEDHTPYYSPVTYRVGYFF